MKTLLLPIELEELPPEVRSWLITKSAAEKVDPGLLIQQLLRTQAAQDGFAPEEGERMAS